MIEHVYRRTCLCKTLDEVYLATCDSEIAEATERFGGRVVMTASSHQRASDRVAEVAQNIEADIVVMVQGDEPMVLPEMIDLTLEPLLRDPKVVCANLAVPIQSESEFLDPNTIKVVIAENGDALYFSRQPIPSHGRLPFGRFPAYRQVCVIPFRRDFLLRYSSLRPTSLEQAESIDMLRALEHGYPIRIVQADFLVQSVDTPADLERARLLMRNDPHMLRYGQREVMQ
jgi:3-deoxy-manno-octulosonate cytidylyltransferase (CMP-KDO synthetase)